MRRLLRGAPTESLRTARFCEDRRYPVGWETPGEGSPTAGASASAFLKAAAGRKGTLLTQKAQAEAGGHFGHTADNAGGTNEKFQQTVSVPTKTKILKIIKRKGEETRD